MTSKCYRGFICTAAIAIVMCIKHNNLTEPNPLEAVFDFKLFVLDRLLPEDKRA